MPDGAVAALELDAHLRQTLRAIVDDLPPDLPVRWSVTRAPLRTTITRTLAATDFDILVLAPSTTRHRWTRRLPIRTHWP